MLATAQSEATKPYIYNILTFSGSLKKEGFKVDVDNGKEIEKLKDANGKTVKFKTPAAALMYQVLPSSGDSFGAVLGSVCLALLTYVIFPMLGGVLGFMLGDFGSRLSGEPCHCGCKEAKK